MFPTFSPAGDAAILVTFGETIALEINRRAHALARLLQVEPLEGLGEAVPGYTTLLVHYDPLALDYRQALEWIEARAGRAVQGEAGGLLPEPRRVEVPVFYGGEHGPDLGFVAEHNHLTPQEVVQIHSQGDYPVYLIGFTPGFPYLGGLDERIAAPRLAAPRTNVPAGAVGIGGQQTGIYSVESPGGWRLIGWTPLKLFDPLADPPALLAPGDVVRFKDVGFG
jgi:inhibitor of KinA